MIKHSVVWIRRWCKRSKTICAYGNSRMRGGSQLFGRLQKSFWSAQRLQSIPKEIILFSFLRARTRPNESTNSRWGLNFPRSIRRLILPSKLSNKALQEQSTNNPMKSQSAASKILPRRRNLLCQNTSVLNSQLKGIQKSVWVVPPTMSQRCSQTKGYRTKSISTSFEGRISKAWS